VNNTGTKKGSIMK